MKNIAKVIMVIMGTLIGAGFASGREIYLFFLEYGYYGIIGIFISGIFTSFIIYIALNRINNRNVNTYSELLENNKNKKIGIGINIIVNAFLIISFFIMIAGFSAYMKQAYEIPIYASSFLFVLVCYIIFRKSLQGMMKINEYIVPVLLFFIVFLGIKNIPYIIESKAVLEIETKQMGFIINSLLYASYNSIILIPVLVNIKKYYNSKKEIKLISIISGIFIIILSLCIYGLLLRGQFFVKELELPLLQIISEFGIIFKYIYSFIIIASILTSAISTGYSFLDNVSKNKKNYQINLIIICMVGVLVSNIGFSNLVQILYPLFGILGFIQIIFLLNRK